MARNFFLAAVGISLIFILGHFYAWMQILGLVLLGIFFLLFVLDIFLLFRKANISADREVSSVLSNGDKNPCTLQIYNTYKHSIHCQITEEIPHQLSIRELRFTEKIGAMKSKEIAYELEPKERGEYDFGDIVVMANSPLRLVARRYVCPASKKVAVYPSFIHLKKHTFKNFKYYSQQSGNKRTRKIGHSTEFEHIKGYVKGDDIRHINWKSSAKHGNLMVNQYVDEKAQQIYCAIDTGRAMQMPFNGMTLLDYAINSTLALSHVIIRNSDQAGVLYFNKKVEKILPVSKAIRQLSKIYNVLYNLETTFAESNFEELYSTAKFKLSHRSLLLIFTNFEDTNSVDRQLPYLRGLAKNNVVVVVFFKNTELNTVARAKVQETKQFYEKAIAEKLIYQKKLIAKQLNKYGIHTVLTAPENLTTDTIDKYLEIKARGLI